MLKSIEVQGRTEDEAIELALEQLGLQRDDVSVEVLETAKTGLFGKKIPALIKVEYESDEEDPGDLASTAGKDSAPKAAPVERKVARLTGEGVTTSVDEQTREKISSYLTGLFQHMGLDVSMNIFGKDDAVHVTLETADPGVLIGRRGETLDALQHLTNYSINRSAGSRTRIHLDAENYRQRRNEALVSLALRTAGKVAKYRRNLTLDPMNAYERHIIHAALQDHEQVSTFSVGNDANRRVVIAYGGDKDSQSKSSAPEYKEWH